MATRETLKDLQARLATRLDKARSTNIALTWLAVTAGSMHYLFPLRQSGEILPSPQLRAVPRTKNWFLGVVNVRGSLFGTVDLADFVAQFYWRDPKPYSNSAVDESQAPSIVTFHPALEVNCALQVSALSGLRSADSFTSAVPALTGAPRYFGNQFFDAQNVCWQEINLQELSQTPEFLNIST